MTSWIISYGAGWLITLSPCVLPILPLLLSGAANKSQLAPLLMALGLALSFALLGTLIGLLGDSLGLNPTALRAASAVLLLAASVFMLVPQLGKAAFAHAGAIANIANNASLKLDGFGLWGSLLTGALLGAVWAPCSGPALVAAAGLAAEAGTAADAFMRLLFFGFGAATPLLLIAYGTRGLLLDWLRRNSEGITRFFGFFLGAIAFLILSGYDLKIQEWIISLLPQSWLLTLTSL